MNDVTLARSSLSGNTSKGHFYYYYYPGYPNPYYFLGTSRGGGAYAGGRFTITGSTVTHNTAVQNDRGSVGGGFTGRSGGNLISGSTIDNNNAWLGGGFAITGHYAGETDGATIVNSTISGNHANITSGGFNAYRLAYLTLHNTTVTNNSAPYCGGVYIYYGTADIKSSIIGGNTSIYDTNQFGYYTAADLDVFAYNATVAGDHNAIMTSNTPLPADTLTDDPLLLPLADNGGPTLTHAFDTDERSRSMRARIRMRSRSTSAATDFRVSTGDLPTDIGAFEAPGEVGRRDLYKRVRLILSFSQREEEARSDG